MNPTRTRATSNEHHDGLLRLPLLLPVLLILAAACSGQPTAPDLVSEGLEPAGRPVQCDAGTEFAITLRDDPGDALTSDIPGSPYFGHSSGNGNLMLWLVDDERHVNVETSVYVGPTTDRIYTNTHSNPGGTDACGLDGMADPSTGSADFTVELDDNGIVHYGKACDGSPLPDNRVTTTRDGDTWTIEGTQGVYCLKTAKSKNAPIIEGTAGAFGMTLVGLGPVE